MKRWYLAASFGDPIQGYFIADENKNAVAKVFGNSPKEAKDNANLVVLGANMIFEAPSGSILLQEYDNSREMVVKHVKN